MDVRSCDDQLKPPPHRGQDSPCRRQFGRGKDGGQDAREFCLVHLRPSPESSSGSRTLPVAQDVTSFGDRFPSSSALEGRLAGSDPTTGSGT